MMDAIKSYENFKTVKFLWTFKVLNKNFKVLIKISSYGKNCIIESGQNKIRVTIWSKNFLD